MEQFKPLSCGDMDGLLCPRRHLAERYLGMRVQSPEMSYGINLHNIMEVANRGRMRKIDVDLKMLLPFIGAANEDDFNTLAKPYGVKGNGFTCIPFAMKGFAEMSLEWFLERTAGSIPVDAERQTAIEIGGRKWTFKPDCLRLPEEGVLIVDDYKTGYIPDKDEVMHTPRVMLYALATAKMYGVEKVISILWNVSQKFSIRIEWDYDELNRIEKYLQKDILPVVEMHKALQDTPQEHWEALLDDDSKFPCHINAYCRSCPVKASCRLHGQLVGEGIFPEATTLTERVKQVRAAAGVVAKEKDTLVDSLKAEVLINGTHVVVLNSKKEEEAAMSLSLGDGLEALFKASEREVEEINIPTLERFVATHGQKGVEPEDAGTVCLKHGRVELVFRASTEEYEELKKEVETSTTQKLIVRREGPNTGKKASGVSASKPSSMKPSGKSGLVNTPDSPSAPPAGKLVTLSAKNVRVSIGSILGAASQSGTSSPVEPTQNSVALSPTSAINAGVATASKPGKSGGAKKAPALTPEEFKAQNTGRTFKTREEAVAAAMGVKVKGDTVEVFSNGKVHSLMLGTVYNQVKGLLASQNEEAK